MRVLWFTNIQLPAVSSHLGVDGALGGGWMESLRLALHDSHITLGVASVGSSPYASFNKEGNTYFNIQAPKPLQRFASVVHNWGHPIEFKGAVDQCLRVVNDFHPDLIHVQGTENFFGLVAGHTDIPVLLSLQGILSAIYKVYFRGFTLPDLAECMLSQNFLKGRGLVHDYFRMRHAANREKTIIGLASHIAGRTWWDKQIAAQLAPGSPYYHCDRVLRKPFYKGQWDGGRPGDKVIYCTSGWGPYKGVECLLEAVALLHSAGVGGFNVRIAGLPPSYEMQSLLLKRAKLLNIENLVEWLGPLGTSEVVRELECAYIYVMPSHIENNANSLCEAMMVGTPCVASYVGGVPSMIKDDKEGLMFPAGDAYALAGQLIRLLENKALALKLSQNARATALARHDPQRVAARMIEIYRSIIRNP